MARRSTSGARRRTDGGVAVLEMVLVLPFLLLLLFGIGEYSLAWVSANRLEGAVSAAARVGSSQGSVTDADRAILLQLQASLPEDLLDNVTRVVVYESDASGSVPEQCRTINNPTTQQGQSGRCNLYSGNTLRTITVATNLGAAQNFWAPSTRLDRLSGPPDYIGVLVQTRHDDVTGTFWRDGFDLERRSVYRIQPDIDG
jgi:Flp pilus assembly protein TadG